jgi:hypothetical protein
MYTSTYTQYYNYKSIAIAIAPNIRMHIRAVLTRVLIIMVNIATCRATYNCKQWRPWLL